MYIILKDDEKKVLGICKDRSKAIILRNYFEHEMADMIRKGDIILLEANKDVLEGDSGSDSKEKWTDIALEKEPLDFKLNVMTDLQPNNWIYEEFEKRKKDSADLKVQEQEREARQLEIFESSFEKVKDKYLSELRNLHRDVEKWESENKTLHQVVIEGKKKVKKKMMTEKELEDLCTREKNVKAELGKKRRKYTMRVGNAKDELVRVLADHGIQCRVDTYGNHRIPDKVHVLTADIVYGSCYRSIACKSIYLD